MILDRLSDQALPILQADPGNKDNADFPANFQEVKGIPANTSTNFVTTQSVQSYARIKTLAILVTIPVAQTAGQATIQMFAGMTRYAGDTTGNFLLGGLITDQQLRGAAVNFGPNAANIPIGMYFISVTDIPEMANGYPYVGFQFKFNIAATTGSLRCFLGYYPF